MKEEVAVSSCGRREGKSKKGGGRRGIRRGSAGYGHDERTEAYDNCYEAFKAPGYM